MFLFICGFIFALSYFHCGDLMSQIMFPFSCKQKNYSRLKDYHPFTFDKATNIVYSKEEHYTLLSHQLLPLAFPK